MNKQDQQKGEGGGEAELRFFSFAFNICYRHRRNEGFIVLHDRVLTFTLNRVERDLFIGSERTEGSKPRGAIPAPRIDSLRASPGIVTYRGFVSRYTSRWLMEYSRSLEK